MCILYRIYIHTYLPTYPPAYLPTFPHLRTIRQHDIHLQNHWPSQPLKLAVARHSNPSTSNMFTSYCSQSWDSCCETIRKPFRAAWQCCDVLWGKWNSQCPRITCGWFPTPYDKKWPHSLVARLHQRLKRFPAVNSIHCHQIFWWYLVMIWVMSNKDIICYFWYTIFRIGNDWKMEMIGFPFLDAWWGGFICHWFADSSR